MHYACSYETEQIPIIHKIGFFINFYKVARKSILCYKYRFHEYTMYSSDAFKILLLYNDDIACKVPIGTKAVHYVL